MIKKSNEPANNRALKQQFIARAKALSNRAEAYRCPQVTLLICETVAFGVRAKAEIFKAAYGDPSGRKYWDACLSEPTLAYTLAHTLSAHLAEKVEQMELARIAIIRAFRDAAEGDESWFIGDISALLAIEEGQRNFGDLRKVKVHPRDAVAWLLSKPMREHLVPGPLRTFLRGKSPNPAKRASITQKMVERFVANYIKGERSAGRSPTVVGLDAAAKQEGIRGSRENLRSAFGKRVEVRRGRPPKPNEKIAKK